MGTRKHQAVHQPDEADHVFGDHGTTVGKTVHGPQIPPAQASHSKHDRSTTFVLEISNRIESH